MFAAAATTVIDVVVVTVIPSTVCVSVRVTGFDVVALDGSA